MSDEETVREALTRIAADEYGTNHAFARGAMAGCARAALESSPPEGNFTERLDALIWDFWAETELDTPELRSALKNLRRAAEDLAASVVAGTAETETT